MGRKCVSEKILPKGRILYFNEEEHKYTDDLGNGYISVTTLIGKYTQEFKKEEIAAACERIGKNPRHPKYQKYKGKTKNKFFGNGNKKLLRLVIKEQRNIITLKLLLRLVTDIS